MWIAVILGMLVGSLVAWLWITLVYPPEVWGIHENRPQRTTFYRLHSNPTLAVFGLIGYALSLGKEPHRWKRSLSLGACQIPLGTALSVVVHVILRATRTPMMTEYGWVYNEPLLWFNLAFITGVVAGYFLWRKIGYTGSRKFILERFDEEADTLENRQLNSERRQTREEMLEERRRSRPDEYRRNRDE